jgi:hypothetical protein
MKKKSTLIEKIIDIKGDVVKLDWNLKIDNELKKIFKDKKNREALIRLSNK